MWTLLLIIFCAAEEFREPVFYSTNEDLRQYLLEATENTPGLRAKWTEWQAALQKVPQVATLDDPMFSYTQFLQSDETRFGLSLEQKFPWFGTLRARKDKALIEADAALSRFYAERNRVVADVKRAYFEYAQLGENMMIVQAQTGILAEVEETVKSRYGLGLASEADFYRVQIERDKLEDMYKGLEQSVPALSGNLLEALGRDTGEPLPWPQPSAFPPPPPEASVVLARIRAANPDLAAMHAMEKGWDKETLLAKKRGYPDFSIELGYENMKDMKTNNGKMDTAMAADAARMFVRDAPTEGVIPTLGNIAYDVEKYLYLRESGDTQDDVMISLKVSLPIWRSRIKAGIQEARLMRKSVEYDRRRATLSLESAARMSLYNIQDAQRRFNLYSEVLIPKERLTYGSLQIYYGVGVEPGTMGGSADFLDILNSVQSLLEYQLEQARAARDLQVACAELEMLMGGPWAEAESEASTANVPETSGDSSQVQDGEDITDGR